MEVTPQHWDIGMEMTPWTGISGLSGSAGSGSIDAEELRVVLQGCLRESSLALPEERLGALSQALLQALDRDGSGSISFPELREQLEAFPELLESLSSSASSWLKPPSARPAEHRLCCFSRECRGDPGAGPCCFSRECRGDRGTGPCCFSRECRGDPGAGPCCLLAWLAASALLLALGALWHRGRGPALALARGCGQSLNLNCALLAALMLRRSLTWLRSTPLAELFPLERHVRGHELVAFLVLALATAHAGAHLAHAGLSRLLARGGGGAAGTAPHSGLALQALLLAMLLGSGPCVRRGGHFQVFYWSHLCYIPVWFLLLLHAPHFWKWFLIPGSLFVLEKVLGWAWRRAGDLHILEAKLLPSKVTHLVIQRPKSFRFQPGDYVYLNVPAIAAYEWHPFSISSAPEQPETLWLHIRALGQWTNKLYEYFQQLESRGPEPNPPGKSRGGRRSRHWEQVGLWDWDQRDGAAGSGVDPTGSSQFAARESLGMGIPCLSGLEGPWNGNLCPVEWEFVSHGIEIYVLQNGILCPMEWEFVSLQRVTQSWQRDTKSHAGSVALGRDRAVELTAFRASGAALPGEDPEQGWLELRVRSGGKTPKSREFGECLEWGMVSAPLSPQGSAPGETQRSCSVKCFLDGPYGTPSRRIFTSEHAVLIGAGIGITPFASILQSIMFRYRRRRQSCPSCRFSWSEERRDEEMTLRKVDFIWITRDQQHLQWFLGLLAKLEAEQAELEPGGKFLELHLYMTSALGKGDVRALGLQLALDLLAAREERDSITGLRARTRPGRPDWDKVFGKVAAERRGRVRVFFCGSAALGRVIRRHCRSFGFAFSKENF
ncbi:NADPH oxidase 5 [Prinia subflava]|uniref:NADPH oxidase 5 n=1 Tax=Prinia subflava TaxID=208062 RepID=UPI002FE35E0F